MIYGYQLVNERTEILSLATSHTAFPQFNHVFALQTSMPHSKINNFYRNRPKIKLLLQKKY